MYLIKKTIKNKEYLYLEKSIRLPNNKVRTINKRVEEDTKKNLIKKYKNYFIEKEKELHYKFAIKNYKYSSPLTKEQIKKLESIKLDYKKIIKSLNKPRLQDVFDRFTLNFTYESNAIEGNSLTLKDVAIVIFENQNIKGKTLREIYETRNSRKAIDSLLNNKIKINHKDIIKLHSILMKDIDEDKGYKKLPNIILGSKLNTTPPEKTYKEMDNLIKWYHENKKIIYPPEIISEFHGRFTQIHPFPDGNGRVGRILINAILLKNKYPPLIIRKTSRQAYLKSLEDYDNNYDFNLKNFLLKKLKKTYENFFEVYYKYI